MTTESIYASLGVRPFINARGTITTLGGSIMPPAVLDAMVQASRHFVPLNDLHEKVGQRLARLTGAEAAFVCAGAASGMLLAGAACITGTDVQATQRLPEVGDRPSEFVISLVDSHTYVHQGFVVVGGRLVRVGTREAVTPEDYAGGVTERTAALVFFLGTQSREQLPAVIAVARRHQIPVIVDAAAQLPPRANLTDLTAMGADLVVFSGGKGLCGPQSTGLILGRRDLIQACALNSNPYSAVGRGMKVGKEEVMGLLKAVELFMAGDEDALIQEWESRCRTVAAAVADIDGIRAELEPPYATSFPPASPELHLHFGEAAPESAAGVIQALEGGEPSIVVDGAATSLTICPQTLQPGEAEIIAARLREILPQS